MDKINKLTLPATILITSIILGGFFYASQVNKQRSIERQQEVKLKEDRLGRIRDNAKEKAKVEQEQQAKEEAGQALSSCIDNAEEKYQRYWDSECKRLGKVSSSCIAILDMTFAEYLKNKGLTKEEYKKQRGITDDSVFAGLLDYGKRKNECSCALPTYLSDNATEILEGGKDECFKRYPQK